MEKLMTLLKSTFCVLVLVLIVGNRSLAQDDTVANKNVDLAQRQLENVHIEEENIGDLLSHFSFAYDIPIGLEIAHKGYELDIYRIKFKKGTLSDLMTQFVAEYKQYDWKIEDGVLSVFPKEDYRDPLVRELLMTNISSFSVKEKTSAWGFAEALASTPEIKRILELHGVTCDVGYLGGFYIQQLGQQFTLDVSNMQLKAILDQVIKESPVARNWIIANKTSAQKILLRVYAALEYRPKEPNAPIR
jgi:hypothetical protein